MDGGRRRDPRETTKKTKTNTKYKNRILLLRKKITKLRQENMMEVQRVRV